MVLTRTEILEKALAEMTAERDRLAKFVEDPPKPAEGPAPIFRAIRQEHRYRLFGLTTGPF